MNRQPIAYKAIAIPLCYIGLAARLLPGTSLCYGSRWTDMQGTPQLKPCKWSGETRTHNVTLLAALPLELHSIPFCGTDTSYSKTIVTLEARSHFIFCDRNSLIKPLSLPGVSKITDYYSSRSMVLSLWKSFLQDFASRLPYPVRWKSRTEATRTLILQFWKLLFSQLNCRPMCGLYRLSANI